jgi:hypothetical protein
MQEVLKVFSLFFSTFFSNKQDFTIEEASKMGPAQLVPVLANDHIYCEVMTTK